ncbi:MAG TPA: CHRD domain-containing protein [Stellaceae bacterium]
MRKSVLVLGLLATAAMVVYGQAAPVSYKTNLAGNSEVPPVNSQGKGSAQVTADSATNSVSWRVEFAGLSGPATAAHIHCGAAAGANAGVAVPLGNNPTSPITGQGTMTPAQMQQLQGGQCYINVHTAANPGGEIRGQLAP